MSKVIKTKNGGTVTRREKRVTVEAIRKKSYKPGKKTIKIQLPTFEQMMSVMVGVLIALFIIGAFVWIFSALSSQERIDEPYQDYDYYDDSDNSEVGSKSNLPFISSFNDDKVLYFFGFVIALIIFFNMFRPFRGGFF